MRKVYCLMDFTMWGDARDQQYVTRIELKHVLGTRYYELLNFIIDKEKPRRNEGIGVDVLKEFLNLQTK